MRGWLSPERPARASARRPRRTLGAGEGITERLARASAAHPKRTLGVWGIIVVVSLALVATSLRGLSTDARVVGKPESTKAADLYAQAFPPTAAQLRRQVSDVIVVRSDRSTVEAPEFRRFVSSLVAKVRATGKPSSVGSYLSGGERLVSRDRHATLVQVLLGSNAAAKPVVELVQEANRSPGFAVAITGDRSVGNDFNTLSQRDIERGELAFGLPAALLVLLLVFGAVVAGLVPVLMALVAIAVGLGLVALLSFEFNFSVFIVNMLTGMGLALGIDYSLFVISRYREERGRGLAQEAAIRVSGATASRAVLFSGGTFVVALFGMLIVPTTIMRSLAVGAIIVGVVSVAAALTLLPALLSLVGDRVNALRVPVLGRNLGRADAAEGRLWRAVVERVLRRPALSLALTAGLMLATAVPVLGLHIGQNGVTSLPNSLPSKQGYLALQREFPAQNPTRPGSSSRATALLAPISRGCARDSRPTRASARARSRPAATRPPCSRCRCAAMRSAARRSPPSATCASRSSRPRSRTASASSSAARRPRPPTTSTPSPSRRPT